MFQTFYKKLKTLERNLGINLGSDISTPAARRRAYIHFHLLDHGFLRKFWTNLSQISPGVWRANQPSARQLRKYKNMGIHTILNLRGAGKFSQYLFEKEACDSLGVFLVDHALSARRLANRNVLLALLDHFDSLDRPFLMHCKSGADRAGLAAALYLLHVENAPVRQAKKQLSLRFLHVRSFQTGILDHMLEAYESDIERHPMPIREWIETRYDSQRLTAEFNAERGLS